jgi:UDP-3-O-[3-hydroxymyristoyl] glucosamine N-acyltransferase
MTFCAKKFSLRELATLTNAELVGNPDHEISNVDSLERATLEDASFLANPRYKEALMQSKAGVICVDPQFAHLEKNLLVSSDPSRTFQKIVELISRSKDQKTAFQDIHPTAIIDPSAMIGKNAQIGPYAVIDRNVTIGDDVKIAAHVSIGSNVKIGSNCLFYPKVIIREGTIIGNRVILQPGVVIGSCGYGYINQEGSHIKLDQIGIVVLEDDVEIGANTTIDRARFKETRIGKGTKIDNLVQIGHNVEIGEHNLIIAQTGIAGSTKTGKYVCLAGQTGVVGHIKIGDGVIVAAKGGVAKSILEAGKYAGVPAMPIRAYNESQVHLRKLSKYVEEIKELKARIEKLEQA